MRLWPWSNSGRKASTWETFRAYFAEENAVKSGAKVNITTALQVGTAFACARVIAEGLAQVPLKIHSESNGTREDAIKHPAYWLLHKRPNDLQTSFEFREQIALHLVFCFNAYVFKSFSVTGKLLELLPLEPGTVTVTQLPDRTLRYRVRIKGGEQMEIQPSQIWHIRGPSWDGWQGLEFVRVAREILGLSMALEEHSARMFSNGAKVAGVLSTDANLNKEQLDMLRQSWQDAQGGSANAYKTAILYGGLKWNPMAMQSDSAQHIEQRRLQIEEVCRVMRVLPIMVGSTDKTATYASVEQMLIAHVTHTLMPWYRRLEDSIDVNLIGMNDIKAGLYAKFNANGLLRGSTQARGEFYTKLYNIGAINPNQIRALEEMNPYDGGEQYRVPLNMIDPSAEPADPAGDVAKE